LAVPLPFRCRRIRTENGAVQEIWGRPEAKDQNRVCCGLNTLPPTRIENTVRCLGGEGDDTLDIAEKIEV
jgi:hypothetical protein